MKITDIENRLISVGFVRSNQPLSIPIVVHGVPGCGKSTLIRSLLNDPDVIARTVGPAYGKTLLTTGVLTFEADETVDKPIRILDEYQHCRISPQRYNFLFGDPFQGNLHFTAHYSKELSHRVPQVVANFLRGRDYTISGENPGSLTTASPFSCPHSLFEDSDCILHLGPVSQHLATSHCLPTRCAREVAGLEYNKVTLIYHSSELSNREDFYIACTRTRHTLLLLSDEFHELQTSA